jgi:hypothetical protein
VLLGGSFERFVHFIHRDLDGVGAIIGVSITIEKKEEESAYTRACFTASQFSTNCLSPTEEVSLF